MFRILLSSSHLFFGSFHSQFILFLFYYYFYFSDCPNLANSYPLLGHSPTRLRALTRKHEGLFQDIWRCSCTAKSSIIHFDESTIRCLFENTHVYDWIALWFMRDWSANHPPSQESSANQLPLVFLTAGGYSITEVLNLRSPDGRSSCATAGWGPHPNL